MGDKSRQDILWSTGCYHKMMNGHNGEQILFYIWSKELYIYSQLTKKTVEIAKYLKTYSYCVMDNHVHETGQAGWDYTKKDARKKGITQLGNHMRNANSNFAQKYNKKNKRTGKVANSRPKTIEIKSEKDILIAMLYGDANPVRAGMVDHPSKYEWSSYRYFAYGEKSEFSDYIDMPVAYIALGKTPKQRQRAYRSLMTHYLRKNGLLNDQPDDDVIDLSMYNSTMDTIDALIREASLKTKNKPG